MVNGHFKSTFMLDVLASMIPTCIPQLSGNEKEYLVECVETNYVSSVGPFVDKFEQAIADETDGKSAFCTTTGTSALHLALETIGVGAGDLVIIPSLTFIATANAVRYCGADPWIFDIDPDTWTLDPELVAKKLKTETELTDGDLYHRPTNRKISAIVPVHTLGLPADMDEINRIAESVDLPVIADGAAAIGAKYRGEPIGGLADITALSFNGNKTITCGGGGAVVSKNEELIEQAQHLGSTAREGREYHHDQVGFNYRMTNVQAAVGLGQIEQLEDFVEKKRTIRSRYNQFLADIETVRPFPSPDWAESSCWFSGFLVEEDHPKPIHQIRTELEDAGIESPPFWKPIHLQSPYKNAPATTQDNSEAVWERIVTLPSSVGLSDETLENVIARTDEILTSNPPEDG